MASFAKLSSEAVGPTDSGSQDVSKLGALSTRRKKRTSLARRQQSTSCSDLTDTSEDEGKYPTGSCGLYKYQQKKDGILNFTLSAAEVAHCLAQMKCVEEGEKIHKTNTSMWSKTTAASNAAYKLFRVQHWNLKDENLIFDPLLRDPRQIVVKSGCSLLWCPQEPSEGAELSLKEISVDGVLYTEIERHASKQSIVENFIKFDEALKDIDFPTQASVHCLPSVQVIIDKVKQAFPEKCQRSFYRFILAMESALFYTSARPTCREVVYENLFRQFVLCIVDCMGDSAINCDRSMDGAVLDKIIVTFDENDLQQQLLISSKPDLVIYEDDNVESRTKRGIAVVEVKGKAGEKIVHSDDEESGDRLGVISEDSEESEEEVLEVDRTKYSEHKAVTKMKKGTRRSMRKFLPQIIGEMVCLSGTSRVAPIKSEQRGFSLGVAVIGFDVYFVSLLNNNGICIWDTLKGKSFNHVFVTRAFSLYNRNDRRAVVKVIAAACSMKKVDFDIDFDALNIKKEVG